MQVARHLLALDADPWNCCGAPRSLLASDPELVALLSEVERNSGSRIKRRRLQPVVTAASSSSTDIATVATEPAATAATAASSDGTNTGNSNGRPIGSSNDLD